jgi:uncharacterized protein
MRREPQRSCVGCRRTRPKRELVRVAAIPGDGPSVDRSGAAQGRGAYVCPDAECVRLATAKGALGRALRVALGPDDLATLRVEIEKEMAQR